MKFFSIRYTERILTFVCFLAPLCTVQAQTLSQSPYGRFGLGDIQGNPSAYIQSLGGVTQALADSNSLNLSQPAALGALEGGVTIFEAGLTGFTTQYNGVLGTRTGRTAGFGYFGLAFPIKKNKWNVSLSLSPISNAGFSLRDSLTDDQSGIVNLYYSGTGGFQAFSFGNGFHFGKNLNLGLQMRYLFGRTDYSSKVIFNQDTLIQRNTIVTNSNRLNGVDLVAGVQYQIRFHKPKVKALVLADTSVDGKQLHKRKIERDSVHVIFGATFRPMANVNASYSYLAQSFFGTDPGTSYTDTVLFNDRVKGKVAMPLQFGGGITFKSSSDRWLITTDYVYTDWNGFRLFDRVDSVRSSYRVGLGIQINPVSAARTAGARVAYLKKVRYRVGGYYSDGYLRLNGQAVPEMGVSLGFGLPVVLRTYNTRTATSLLNFSITAGQRGATGTNSLTEQFIKGTISFSLNDRWFRKFQYD